MVARTGEATGTAGRPSSAIEPASRVLSVALIVTPSNRRRRRFEDRRSSSCYVERRGLVDERLRGDRRSQRVWIALPGAVVTRRLRRFAPQPRKGLSGLDVLEPIHAQRATRSRPSATSSELRLFQPSKLETSPESQASRSPGALRSQSGRIS